MGYPWNDGFSLIANDLNPAIDHTTLKLHYISGNPALQQIGLNTADVIRSGNTFVLMGNCSFMTPTTFPATASWAMNFAFSMNAPSSFGTAQAKIYWNGAHWNTTLGATHSYSADPGTSFNEDVWLVGLGTVALYGKNSTEATGSVATNSFAWRRRPVFITPV